MTTDRYRVPSPLCNHKRKGRVYAGSPEAGPHASTQVCDRRPCIDAAMAWARAQTHLEPVHVVDVRSGASLDAELIAHDAGYITDEGLFEEDVAVSDYDPDDPEWIEEDE